MSHPITDHALIRYLERVKGIDINMIKNEMLDKRTLEKINMLNNKKPFHVRKEDCILRVVNGKVVTVLNKKGVNEYKRNNWTKIYKEICKMKEFANTYYILGEIVPKKLLIYLKSKKKK